MAHKVILGIPLGPFDERILMPSFSKRLQSLFPLLILLFAVGTESSSFAFGKKKTTPPKGGNGGSPTVQPARKF